MLRVPDSAELMQVASLLAPGIVILAIRSAVREGPKPDLKDRAVNYAAVSAAYYAVAYPIFHWRGGVILPTELWYLLQYFALPAIVGVIAAYELQGGWTRNFAQAFGLYFQHSIPTAWDYTFSEIEEGTFLLVTLNNDTQVGGLLGARSFASSSKEERDLLVEEVYEIAEGDWKPIRPKRSILLCGRDIRHVEVFSKEVNDGGSA